MKLLILIACLLIERYLHIGDTLKRFSWFEGYLTKLQTKIKKDSGLNKGLLGVILVLLPLCLPLVLLEIFVIERQFALSGAGLYFLVLLYCFGPSDLYYQLSQYFKAAEAKNKEHQHDNHNEMALNGLDEDGEAIAEPINENELTETIFTRINCGIFGIVFWFCFGPLFFAIVYRVLCLMNALISKEKEVTKPYENIVPFLYGWFNWIPSRVMAFLYVVAGGFQAFSAWKKYVFTGPDSNQTILVKCGMESLLTDKQKQISPIEESKQAIVLVDRALIIFVVALLVFILGGWL